MYVWVNGSFVPEELAKVSVFDRGFLFGDGLFESIRVYDGRLVLWDAHWRRLQDGVAALQLTLDQPGPGLAAAMQELLQRNDLRDAMLRINVSRGAGQRGYSIRGLGSPTVVITTSPMPALDVEDLEPCSLQTSSHRLPVGEPLSRYKTMSRLIHLMARIEAEAAGANEALLLNSRDRVAETSSANIFWFEGECCCTPALSEGGLAGVTRAFVLQLAKDLDWHCAEVEQPPSVLFRMTGIFLTLSSRGVVEVSTLDGKRVPADARVARLRTVYRSAIREQLCG